jgi:hypothetical protein
MKSENMKTEKRKIGRIVLLAFLIITLLLGLYFKLINMGLFSKLALIGAGLIFVISFVFIILFYRLNGNDKTRWVLLFVISVLVLTLGINTFYLTSDVFIPHTRASYNNRYAEYVLRIAREIEHYLRGKKLMMDSENPYYNWDYGEHDNITMSDILSMNYSATSIEAFDENIGEINRKQIDYLLGLDEKDYKNFLNSENWNRDAYFYRGAEYETCDTVVLLSDDHNRMFFIPLELFLTIKDIG